MSFDAFRFGGVFSEGLVLGAGLASFDGGAGRVVFCDTELCWGLADELAEREAWGQRGGLELGVAGRLQHSLQFSVHLQMMLLDCVLRSGR